MAGYTPGWRNRADEMLDFEASQRKAQFFKLALPAFIIVLLTAIFMWPQVTAWGKDMAKSTFKSRIKKVPELENKVFNPVFKSLDKKGKPVEFQAEVATQVSQELTDFKKPSGTFFLEDGTWIKFWSELGHHKSLENVLDLKDHVRIVTQEGYDIITDSARIFLAEKRGLGKAEVNGVGPIGETIKAEGFRLDNTQRKLTFTGKTNIVYPVLQKDKQ